MNLRTQVDALVIPLQREHPFYHTATITGETGDEPVMNWESILKEIWKSILKETWESILKEIWKSILKETWKSILKETWKSILKEIWKSILKETWKPGNSF
jgi:hypothetical protein